MTGSSMPDVGAEDKTWLRLSLVDMRVRSQSVLMAATTVFVVALVGCSANPGPAPVEEADPSAEPTTSAASEPKQEEKLSEINIGIDPLGPGLNPHLISDDSAFTRTIADLVFPSAFQAGAVNTDLVTSALVVATNGQTSASSPASAEDSPGPTITTAPAEATPSTTTEAGGDAATGAGAPAMTIRYTIRPEAQWSDGTPITVSDFEYLAQQIVATPGALDVALYREISDIRSADGGKTVEVDLATPVANWHDLFRHLLPAHLLRGNSFSSTMASSVPASAGRYSVARIDRQRGVVELNRNDRFWGEDPASVEVINFHEVRSVSQGVEMLSSGQVGFVDLTPTQTSHVAFDLLPGVQSRLQSHSRELAVTANARLSLEQRRALLQAIDIPLLAKLATEREAELEVGEGLPATEQPGLSELFPQGVRIGVDPSDPAAARAATSLKNLYERAGVAVTEVETDTESLLRDYVSTGKVDLVIAWERSFDLSRYQCGIGEADTAVQPTASNSQAATPTSAGPDRVPSTDAATATAVVGTNFSGWCRPDTDAFIAQAISDQHSADEATAWAQALDRDEAIRVWITRDTRLEVLGTSIVGPSPELQTWPEGMSSVLTWRKNG
ncbi:ABC transporter family substrate-binding protein [Corynebacterium sp. SCR221107]|uniref:ABC transporter family substrate-binding protein n=1 Tax=Corynebacterium sp. SCR221107 TaxID=3017361 RepID=UPI0022EC3D85|nr:ABC transporter family substrate-binding protein [Corynebacterium sp. SCR221107]WBT09703.1 ABC transporter family substrate-binding protein [Corynebacterium sp. SCR221107]